MAIPVFIPAIVGALGAAVASLTGRVLVALGVGFVSFTGLNLVVDGVKNQIVSSFGSLPTLAVQILSTLQFDTCVSIWCSALAARLVVGGLTSGSISRMIFK